MRHQVTEKIGPMVNTAIDKHAQGDQILWEPQLMPGQQGEAMLVCFFWMPGVVLGSTMQGSFSIVDPLGVTEAEVDEIVAEFLHQMRNARSEQIERQTPGEEFSGTMRHPEPVPTPQEPVRGQQRPSGLLIP